MYCLHKMLINHEKCHFTGKAPTSMFQDQVSFGRNLVCQWFGRVSFIEMTFVAKKQHDLQTILENYN